MNLYFLKVKIAPFIADEAQDHLFRVKERNGVSILIAFPYSARLGACFSIFFEKCWVEITGLHRRARLEEKSDDLGVLLLER